MRAVSVWDLPTRLFHWILAAFVLVDLFVVDDDPGVLFLVHSFVGYGVLALLGFRLIWGFVGSRRSRFADFVRSWGRVRAYTAGLVKLAPERHVGHNPLGGWMVVVLLAVTFLTAATGLFAGEEEVVGPYARAVGRSAEPLGELHEAFANLLIPLIVVHVLGVVADWLLTGDNLIRAMIDGRKELDETEAAAEPALVSLWRAVVAVAVVAFVGGYIVALS